MTTSYCGKILRVDLNDRTYKVEDLDMDLAKKFVGGRGLGTKMYMDEVSPEIDPFSPDNKLIIISGPLTGTPVPTGGRYMVVTKSPLTGMIACSNSGGTWGAKLKYAGYDAIILEGKSEKPCYINIVDDQVVEFFDADDLWGCASEEVVGKLKEKHEGCNVLNIGPGGETLSLLAAVVNDTDRAAGRSGVGAVMGSKNLKAICVTASRGSVPVNDAEALKEVVAVCQAKIKENGITSTGLPTFGTALLVNILNSVGGYPTKNWQEAQDPNADETSGETLKEKYLIKNSACHRCPISCGRVVKVDDEVVGGPEYETIWAYGSNCGVSDLEAISKANWMCNEMGIDTISVGCTIASAMELYQRGIISDADCEGIPLEWGNGEAIWKWTERMGRGETELGKLMAQGSYRLCDHYGVPEYSMSVKKQEMPAYDARAVQGMGVTYATSNRGGCHVRGYTVAPEIAGIPEQIDRTSAEGKHIWAKAFQDLTAVIDSAGLCLFTSFALGAQEYADLINAATGTDYNVDSVMEAGERIYNLERVYNQKAGMKPEDDCLPKRMLEEPIPDGPSKGMVSKLPEMLPKYYEARGWVDAFPTPETLERLGL